MNTESNKSLLEAATLCKGDLLTLMVIEFPDKFFLKPESSNLIASNKRIKNILKDLTLNLESIKNLQDVSEKNLLECLEYQEKALICFLEATPKQYTEALQSLSTLDAPLCQFFESVMVMCEDPTLRNSRLVLLKRIQVLFLQIADFSFL